MTDRTASLMEKTAERFSSDYRVADEAPTKAVYVLPPALITDPEPSDDSHVDSETVTSKVYNCCY